MNIQNFSIITIVFIILYNRSLNLFYKYPANIIFKFVSVKLNKFRITFILNLIKVILLAAVVIEFDINLAKVTLITNNSINVTLAIELWGLMLCYPQIWANKPKNINN